MKTVNIPVTLRSFIMFHFNLSVIFHTPPQATTNLFNHQSILHYNKLLYIFKNIYENWIIQCTFFIFISFFIFILTCFISIQFSSVAQSCPTLCDPMDCSTPGLPVHHQLLEVTETRVHWVGDAIQPSHPLLSPSAPAFNLSRHQGLFKWVSSLHQVAKALELQV